MIRKNICLLLVFTMILTSLSIPARAAGGKTGWTVDGTHLTISGSGDMEEAEEYPWSGEYITSVTIDEGIKSVASGAFKGMWSIRSIIVPGSVTYIGENAIESGTGLQITGIKESYAETYARECGISFRYPVASVNVSNVPFTGAAVKPEISVRYSDGSACDLPYTVRYENNTEAGKASAHAVFTQLGGSADCEFTIDPVSIEGAEVTIKETSPMTPSGAKADIVLKYGSRVLKVNKDYTLSYTDNEKLGTATVTATGIGSFYGSISRQFTVIPSNVWISKAYISSSSIKLTWEKAGRESSGYELEIGTDKKFKVCDRYDISNVSTVSKVIKKVKGKRVKKGKLYYVRIRSYAETDEKVYGEWFEYTKRGEFVQNAQKWLGYDERNGKYKKIIDKYNSVKPRPVNYKVKYWDEWCAVFISAVATVTKLTALIPRECSCPRMIERMKKMHMWVENDAYVPKPGDIIFYDWQDSGKGDCRGNSDHVGIVVSVTGKTIKVIEGNKYISGRKTRGVGYRYIKVNGRYIRGYGVPKC